MNKLGIIIPYRDRPEHLKKFIPHINNFLNNKLDYEILLVEQDDKKSFNRGKLLNIGAEILKNNCNYFCFHDIDMLPASETCDYSIVEGVCKLSYFVSQFNFIPRPPDELGGVTLIDKKSFFLVNGYNNNYWGWGVEDNDFALRCKIKNINFSFREGKFFSLFHKPNGDTHGEKPSDDTTKNREYFNFILKNQNLLFEDGITTLKYKINNTLNESTFRHIKVAL